MWVLPMPREINGRHDGAPYLSRWYLCRARRLEIYLHQLHRADDDRALHNHPWKWAVVLVLAGGYSEAYRTRQGNVRHRLVRPWRPRLLLARDFHRIDRIASGGTSWSLFVTGPRHGRGWGFWHPDSGVYRPASEYLNPGGAA